MIGFKSAVCYRTGLAVTLEGKWEDLEVATTQLHTRYQDGDYKELRLQDKPLNDLVVRIMMEVGGKTGLPGESWYHLRGDGRFNKCIAQFHTGLGDNDLMLSLANPSLLQPLIAAYPRTSVVLLHASYPVSMCDYFSANMRLIPYSSHGRLAI